MRKGPGNGGGTKMVVNSPLFVEKVRGIVGLCLAPPGRALVLCVDEKPHVWMAPGLQGEI